MPYMPCELSRDRRGIALPFALIGLVAISILVTTVLMTSSTEFAISAAHRDAATSLYAADAAMEEFVASRFQDGLLQLDSVDGGSVTGSDGRTYAITVTRLAWMPDLAQTAASDIYSLLVEPASGRGRALGAFITTDRNWTPLSTNINAGATSGGDLKVSGNATVSDGRSGTNYCNAADNQSEYAVQVSSGSKITTQGSSTVEGGTNVAEWHKKEMADVILGGLTLHELAEQAQYKFGKRWNTAPLGNTRVNSERGQNYQERFDWGCPLVLGASCPTNAAIRAAATARHVVVALDADKGTITMNGDYGQGMIIVVNGSLRIQGNFIFKGIILVEEDMDIRGGQGGEESKIEGAVIAFGAQSTVEDNISGTATIKYNICAIREAERALNHAGLASAGQTLRGGTWAWHEIVR